MPDTTTLGVIAGIVLILAILGLVYLRILFVRFLYNMLLSAVGRTVLGILMCIGGLNYAFNSTAQNHELLGVAIVGGGLLLLVITFGIPILIKHWEKPPAAKAPPFPKQTWPASPPIAPPGISTIPTSQSADFLPLPTMPAPQPQGYWSPPRMPAPQPQGYWSQPTMPTPESGGYFPPSTMPTPGPGGFLPRQYMPTLQPGGTLPTPNMPPMATNIPPQSTPQSQGNRERSW